MGPLDSLNKMTMLARLAAMITLMTAGLGLADVTIATPAQAQVGGYATHGHGGCGACSHRDRVGSGPSLRNESPSRRGGAHQ
jgi:hypothetical protein